MMVVLVGGSVRSILIVVVMGGFDGGIRWLLWLVGVAMAGEAVVV